MSWRWSRLSILALLALLYVSPLSSGDKGLWLTVTALPAQAFGTILGRLSPEPPILLPVRDGRAFSAIRLERREPVLGAALLGVGMPPSPERTARVSPAWVWNTGETILPALAAPRGPPA